MEATTSSRASFSFTLLRRISPICTDVSSVGFATPNYTGLSVTVHPRESAGTHAVVVGQLMTGQPAYAGANGDAAKDGNDP